MRAGSFELPFSMVANQNPEVLLIMAHCWILRAECILMRDVVEYHAISDEFNEVPQGAPVPRYVWLIENHSSGTVIVSARPG